MASVLAQVLGVVDLPLAELASARLDGEVYALGDGWCPIDEIDGPLTRAGAVRMLAPRRAIAELMTAAWIYGVAPEPGQHRFCVDVTARTHLSPTPRVRLREVHCPPEHAQSIGGMSVTTVMRTVIDLARTATTAPGTLAALLEYGGFSSDEALEALARTNSVRDRAEACAMLRAAGRTGVGQPSLTR